MKIFILVVAGIVVAGLAAAPIRKCQSQQPGQAEKDKVEYANERAIFQGHEGGVNAVSFSPDGKLLAVACDGPCVKIWDVGEVKCIKTLDDFGEAVRIWSVCFSSDGKTLATAGSPSPAHIYDVASWEKRFKLDVGQRGTVFIVFAPDGKSLALSSVDQTVTVWDATKGEKQSVLKTGMRFYRSLAYSNDGKNVAIGGYGEAVIWDVAKGTVRWKLEGHEKGVCSVAFSPNSKLLATLEYYPLQNNAFVWDVETGKRICALAIRKKINQVNAASFSPDGKTLAVVGDFKVTLWQMPTGDFIQDLNVEARNDSRLTCLAFSPDGRTIAVGMLGENVRIIDIPKN